MSRIVLNRSRQLISSNVKRVSQRVRILKLKYKVAKCKHLNKIKKDSLEQHECVSTINTIACRLKCETFE